jgi:tetratricopeptide (TPR) repeat protein
LKALRIAVALLAITASAIAAIRIAIPPWLCNLEKSRVNAATILADRARSSYEQSRRAYEMVQICETCLKRIPNDSEFRMLLGKNQHLLGKYDIAELNYRRALELTERPETYANLALLQLDRGQLEEARKSLHHAATFDMSYVEWVSQPMRQEIYHAVLRRHRQLGAQESQLR